MATKKKEKDQIEQSSKKNYECKECIKRIELNLFMKGHFKYLRWWSLNVSALNLLAPLTVMPSVTIQDTLDLLNKEGFDQVPVVDETG